MFSKSYFFRYGDIDKNNNIKTSSVFDILQDVSIAHSTYVGYSVKKLKECKIAIILRGWNVKFLDKLNEESEVIAKTGIMKLRHFETLRKYELWQDGICKVIATASWIPVNTETLKIASLTDEMKKAYTTNEEDNLLPFQRVKMPCGDVVGTYKIMDRDIDTNFHLNNVKSVELALCFAEEKNISQIMVTYPNSVYKDETIKIKKHTDNNETYLEILNEKDISSVVILLKSE